MSKRILSKHLFVLGSILMIASNGVFAKEEGVEICKQYAKSVIAARAAANFPKQTTADEHKLAVECIMGRNNKSASTKDDKKASLS
ncbi:MAG: hypothetical protein LBI87_07955 [Candidatus Accumulibacter sp.]|jgi:hypothetical protein|nr:hypothetical protein [Accumulibacter sp.]